MRNLEDRWGMFGMEILFVLVVIYELSKGRKKKEDEEKEIKLKEEKNEWKKDWWSKRCLEERKRMGWNKGNRKKDEEMVDLEIIRKNFMGNWICNRI